MKFKDFINKNWDEIEHYIRAELNSYSPHNDMDFDELEIWVLNDESLYNWARSEGVKI